MYIVTKDGDGKNGDFTHKEISITCYTKAELDAIIYVASNSEMQMEISAGDDISSETRGNVGYFLNYLYNCLCGGKI
jgi:hypothetical protein